eukprot:TRINITY_DN89815_c0_g1_i1.p1 TRINITY_DN89815_c0_g1~~TRINITY_DN89815_c0_g1_i1.p1  ORF type:complete len:219 (-),score=45.36 TRINITY_DN89815_c0_g1_i1:41-667(-)
MKLHGSEWGEDVSQQYRELVREKILDPLGMNRSTFLASEMAADSDHAVPHGPEGDAQESCDRDDDPLVPSGGLKASARDMMKFLQCELNRGEGLTSNISEATLQKTWEPNTGVQELGEDSEEGIPCMYAVGWEVSEDGDHIILAHEGSYDGMTSVLAMMPDQNIGMVLLKNTENGEDGDEPLLGKMVSLVMNTFQGKDEQGKRRKRRR